MDSLTHCYVSTLTSRRLGDQLTLYTTGPRTVSLHVFARWKCPDGGGKHAEYNGGQEFHDR